MGARKAPRLRWLFRERKKSSWECPLQARWCLQSLIARKARSRRPHLSAHLTKGGLQLFVGYRRARQRIRQTKPLYTASWFRRRCWTFFTQFGTMEHSMPGVFGAKQSNHLSTVRGAFEAGSRFGVLVEMGPKVATTDSWASRKPISGPDCSNCTSIPSRPCMWLQSSSQTIAIKVAMESRTKGRTECRWAATETPFGLLGTTRRNARVLPRTRIIHSAHTQNK